jgi:hypothetical protein
MMSSVPQTIAMTPTNGEKNAWEGDADFLEASDAEGRRIEEFLNAFVEEDPADE